MSWIMFVCHVSYQLVCLFACFCVCLCLSVCVCLCLSVCRCQRHSTPSVTLCRICEREFVTLSGYVAHMTARHGQLPDMPYACQLCHYQSSVYNDVIAHFRKVRHCLSFTSFVNVAVITLCFASLMFALVTLIKWLVLGVRL